MHVSNGDKPVVLISKQKPQHRPLRSILPLLRSAPDLFVPAISGDGLHLVVCHMQSLVNAVFALYEGCCDMGGIGGELHECADKEGEG